MSKKVSEIATELSIANLLDTGIDPWFYAMKADGTVDYKVKKSTLLKARPYKVYTALLTQSGTDAPTAIVLENTIGEIVWSYDGTGSYIGTLVSAFTLDKTFVICNSTNGTSDDLVQASTPPSADVVLVYSWNIGTISDNVLVNTPIEIRVYL